ncbi:MAG TPA: hypothetical protein VFE47_03365 [Tepidisphaeraceae bacterium]|jgi:ubiquitin-protein ligase|nr:hypothetical protein [Tepidisphaeraceae bacterium]
MWDEIVPDADDQQPPSQEQEPAYPEQAYEEPEEPAANVTWTDGQLMRLENEFRKAQRSFAYHPVIGIRPLRGDPPYEYQVDYRLRTLVTNDAGELEYADAVSMHIWLPPGFPNQPPVVRPMAPVFHPNVAWEGIYLTRPWQPTDTLVTFCGRIGELLAYRSYDPESVINAVAMDWLSQNSGTVPLDTQADFSPFNGGEPLGRIARLGPGTLEQIRRALDDMRFALVAEQDAPTADEVADFARQTRSAISLFLDGDVPENLRQQASEFDDWCRELPESVPVWEYLRAQRDRAAAAERAAAGLKAAAGAFAAGLDELEKMVPNAAGSTPAAAVRLIPPMEKLAPMQLKLPPLARDFEKYSLECRKLIAAMKAVAPETSVAPENSLGRRLSAQSATVREAVVHATRTTEAALAEVDVLYRRARPEIVALEHIVGWREYMDMFAKARTLEKQLLEWGSAGVQAYFIANASGSFGPFQFEEPLDLDGTSVVVRSLQGGQIEVINSLGQEVLGKGTGGSAMVVIGKTDSAPGYETTFTVSERCDDLVVQIGFIQQQTVEALSELQRPVAGAKSWCGIISALLTDPHQQQNLREAHRNATLRWKTVIGDLAALARFKERLATYHLVSRMSAEVPRIQGLISKAHARHAESTEKIGSIMSRSSRDMETDRLIIPPKFAKSYAEELRARDQSKIDAAKYRSLLKQIARELAARVSTPRLVGRPEVAEFRVIGPMADALAALAEVMADEPMGQMIDALGGLLGVPLAFNAPPPPVVTHTPRPPAPAAKDRPQHVARPAAPAAGTEAEAAPAEAGASEEDVLPEVAEGEEVHAGEMSEGEPSPVETGAEHAEVAEGSGEAAFDFGEGEEGQPEDQIIEGFFTDQPPHRA